MRDMRDMRVNAATIAALRDNGARDGLDGEAHASESDVAKMCLKQVLLQLSNVERALTASEARTRAAEQRAESLAADLSSIKRRILLLAQNTARVRFLAHHDGLTGLPNRNLLVDRLKQATAQAARENKQVALLFLDVDGFKGVNDTYGHATGDRLLKQIAEIILSSIRGGDTASRYGGDEFVIMLPNANALAAGEVARKLRATLAAPIVIDGDAIAVTVSIGVAVYPVDAQHYHQLLKHADIEMYLDKAQRPPIGQIP